MKSILPLITFLFLVSCSDPEDPAEVPFSEDVKSPSSPAPTVSPIAKSKSSIFDVQACKFLTEAQIKQILGDQITDVNIKEPYISSGGSRKRFTLTLANGNPLNLAFSVGPVSVKGMEKRIKDFTDNARDIPGLIGMEMTADGQYHIGTHISQRRLYVFSSGQTSVPMLIYDVRGEMGGKTPEEVEARRQMSLSLINAMLKE